MTRMTTCASCGAAVTFARNGQKMVALEPAGFAATINSRNGEVFWQDIFTQHMCQPAAVEARQAFIESVTTEEERRRANDLAEQREMARELAKTFACPKARCEAKINDHCVNLTILNRSGDRVATAWPHTERMKLAMDALLAMDTGAESDADR